MNNDTDLFQDLKLTKRRPLNLIHNLIGRENGSYSSTLGITSAFTGYSNRSECNFKNQLKRIYLSITPNYTILNVKTPNCYFRRFSPDGRFLIGFNQNLNGIHLFQFNGSSAGIQQLERLNNDPSRPLDDKTDFTDYESDQLRYRAFDTYFKEKINIRLTDNNELMNRECALFFKSSYLIVTSSEVISDDNMPPYDQLSTNNESIHFGTIENYTIYLFDVVNNKLDDKIRFKADKLNLIHGQSLCLFKNVFTVLSQQNQTIYVYNILPYKNSIETNNTNNKTVYKFVLVNSIGRFCNPDDCEIIQNYPKTSIKKQVNFNLISKTQQPQSLTSPVATSASNSSSTHRYRTRTTNFRNNNPGQTKVFAENCFTGMKHRILSFFYREALEMNALNQFYIFINNLTSLKMHRMQLLDDNHILIKYIIADHMTNQKLNTFGSLSINNPIFTSNNNPTNIPVNVNTINSSSNNINYVISTSNVNSINNNNNTTTNNYISINSSSNSSNPSNGSNSSQGSVTYNIGLSSLIQSTNVSIINENTAPSYFILYDMQNSKILNILRNTSPQLLNAYENFQDYFSLSILDNFENDSSSTNHVSNSSFSFHTLPSNNAYSKQILQRNFSKYNNHTELTKYILSFLPMSSQSYTTTPYLDHSLFSFDEKLISNLERPKPIGDQIIKFNNRETGRFSFRLYPGTQTSANNQFNYHSNAKRLVQFIWHPREPFCISVQKTNQEFNMNFHVYSKKFS